MLGTVIFYTALLSSVLPINGLRDPQLDAVVKLLESQAITAQSSSSSEDSSSGDGSHSIADHLKTMDVINLIRQANKKKEEAEANNRERLRLTSDALDQLYQNDQYGSNRNTYGVKNRILEQLLNGENNPLKNYHQRLTPNTLLSSTQYIFEKENREPTEDLNEYSKIFVILDPIALQKNKNAENLPNLLSRILAQTSLAMDKAHQDRNKSQRYKGFVVKDSSKSRRFRRESKEKYSGGGAGGDMDDEYRPKRQRNDHNGGGGGGGRTAIPYIRHRGDIYERDH